MENDGERVLTVVARRTVSSRQETSKSAVQRCDGASLMSGCQPGDEMAEHLVWTQRVLCRCAVPLAAASGVLAGQCRGAIEIFAELH